MYTYFIVMLRPKPGLWPWIWTRTRTKPNSINIAHIRNFLKRTSENEISLAESIISKKLLKASLGLFPFITLPHDADFKILQKKELC